MSRHGTEVYSNEECLHKKIDPILLDAEQVKRYEIAQAIIRFADNRKLIINWNSLINYILLGYCAKPFITDSYKRLMEHDHD